jgi:hypothetical protein
MLAFIRLDIHLLSEQKTINYECQRQQDRHI